MEKLGALVMFFLVAFPIMGHCVVAKGANEVNAWFGKLPHAKEKVTKLHFFMHDSFGGNNHLTAVTVAKATGTDKSPTAFGQVSIMDDPIRETIDPTSKELGRAQGLYAFSGQENMSLLMAYNLAFTTGKYNGSTLTVLGRNPAVLQPREMPIVGGSGSFRLARGVATANLRYFNMTVGKALIEYDVVVIHY